MKRLKVFIDSNVFISGLYSGKGSPGLILNNFIYKNINISISQKVLSEIITVLKEKKPDILLILQKFLLSYPPEIVKDPSPESVLKWVGIINKNDAIILESAMACQPDYFITGDKHFFKNTLIEKKSGLKIVKPNEFIDIFKNINI